MIRFDEMQAFLAVVDQGSFLSASVALGVPRTTLRRQIEALEARVGAPLFARSAGGVILTETGRRLAVGARGLERDYRELLGSLRDEERQPAGELRMVVPAGLPPFAEVAAITSLQQAWPGIRLRHRCTDVPLSVSPADADVFIYFGASPPGGAWRTEIMAPARQRLFATQTYLDARGTPARVADLLEHDMLVWHLPGEPESTWLWLPDLAAAPRIAFSSTSPHLVGELALAGRGIACLPSPEPPMTIGDEPLVPVLPDEIGRDMPVRISVARPVAELAKVRAFLDHLQEMADQAKTARPRSAAGAP